MELVFILLLTIWAMPRATCMVPNVAIKGGSLQPATSVPLIKPVSTQMAMVSRQAASGCQPLHISVAEVMQLMPSTEPIDRSMLPVMSTNDWPMPTMRKGANCLNRLGMLRSPRKLGLTMLNTRHSTIRPKNTVMTWPMPRFANALLNMFGCFTF